MSKVHCAESTRLSFVKICRRSSQGRQLRVPICVSRVLLQSLHREPGPIALEPLRYFFSRMCSTVLSTWEGKSQECMAKMCLFPFQNIAKSRLHLPPKCHVLGRRISEDFETSLSLQILIEATVLNPSIESDFQSVIKLLSVADDYIFRHRSSPSCNILYLQRITEQAHLIAPLPAVRRASKVR